MYSPKHIALSHDWLVSMRGGEKVFEVLCELFPQAEVFTIIHRKGELSEPIERMKINTSFIQSLPFGKSRYQYFLPLYPKAMRQFDLRDFDLVISSSSAAAKGVRVRRDALHICYCHTPMRYIWDKYDEYFSPGRASFPTRMAMKMFLNSLRQWDVATANGVHQFIANSRNVQERIKRIYHKDSVVMYPPVDVERFSLSQRDEGYYLIVSALVPYKRVDLAVEAFNRLGKRLVIIGCGTEEKKLKSFAKTNIEFLGWASDEDIAKYYAGCRALIFPGEDDFGIVPVEAMACGKPVLAFAKGGALETVVEGKTGIFFYEQRAESVEKGVKKLEKMSFDNMMIREHSMKFDRNIFKSSIQEFILKTYQKNITS
jgi:glycosyltransferase involved in cell wall biosynthesis